MRKVVTIFGSSVPLPNEEQYEIAYNLGAILAKYNLDVCNGGNRGIMQAVSKGAVDNGGNAIGITLDGVFNNHNPYLTEHIVCKTLFERITKLINTGDAYIILQGGTGTLLELASVWELMNKKFIKQKPFACHGKLWNPLINSMEEQLLLEKRKAGLIKYFDDIEACANYIIAGI
jgi:uncharacterized protein (TIGR00725 family)